MRKILVVSPHPDDESLGCGGTLRKHVMEGDKIHVIFVTSGEQGGHGRSKEETASLREREARQAAAVLGVTSIEFWREPNGRFRVNDRLVKRLQAIITERKPNLIYVTHQQEMHPEHRAAARLVERALSDDVAFSPKPEVLMFEIWTPLHQIDHIVDISDYVDEKRKAIQAHESQCEVMDFDVALLALNRYRGEMHSWPGGDYAEIFSKLTRRKRAEKS